MERLGNQRATTRDFWIPERKESRNGGLERSLVKNNPVYED